MLVLALAACLPHGAVGGVGRGQSPAWAFTIDDATGERCEGRLSLHYAESFRDGSLGWLACLDQGSGPVVARECLELRAFPTGEVLELRGLDAAPALARYDLLWPVVSPALGRDDGMLSWPLYAAARETRRVLATGRWTGGGNRWTLAAVLGDNDPELALSGEVTAGLVMGRGALSSAWWRARREACAGTDCTVREEAGRLEAISPVPALAAGEVSARIAVLSARATGTSSAAGYIALLRGSGVATRGGCPGRTSAEGNLVQSAVEISP